jgi:hypothetical protein
VVIHPKQINLDADILRKVEMQETEKRCRWVGDSPQRDRGLLYPASVRVGVASVYPAQATNGCEHDEQPFIMVVSTLFRTFDFSWDSGKVVGLRFNFRGPDVEAAMWSGQIRFACYPLPG